VEFQRKNVDCEAGYNEKLCHYSKLLNSYIARFRKYNLYFKCKFVLEAAL
jgi:hypothetical protein